MAMFVVSASIWMIRSKMAYIKFIEELSQEYEEAEVGEDYIKRFELLR